MLNKAVDQLRRRLTELGSHLRRSASRDPAYEATVNVLERRQIAGTVRVAPGTGPLRVELCVNEFPVAHTWATPATDQEATDRRLDFRFALADLWRFTKRTDKISVRINGEPAPIVGKGMYYRPRKDGAESLDVLRKRLAEGHVFGQSGRLQLSKSLDLEWQAAVLGLYERVNRVLQETLGRHSFICYGTLLGAVRDNGFIGHDVDFDCAYISEQSTGQAAAAELGEVALELVDRGFNVVPKHTCLAIKDEQSGNAKIDLYHLYWDHTGQLCFPFGIAGTPYVSAGTFDLVPAELAGHGVFIPADAERLVESIYGRNWRTPNPGFRWEDDRTTRARDGIVPIAQVDEVVRANVASSCAGQREAITSLLAENDQIPDVVVEVGSSLGDDSVTIASAGKRVIGLDRSRSSVERSAQRTAPSRLAVEFRVVDIYSPERLSAALEIIRGEIGAATLAIYVRSLLRSSDRVLRSALEALESCSQPGDYLIADFRAAPQDHWPKDKSPDARPPWAQPDLLADLNSRLEWSVVSVAQPASGDVQHSQPGVIVARRG